MKRSLTIKSRLFFAIAAILACSYSILFITSLLTVQNFFAEQTAKDLEFSLKFAKIQFNARQELVLEALKLPAATASVQKLFSEVDGDGLTNASKTWMKSLEFLDMLTIIDARRTVIARSNGRSNPESFLAKEMLNTAFERKQPLITTEVVSHEKYCLEVSSSVCQSMTGRNTSCTITSLFSGKD